MKRKPLSEKESKILTHAQLLGLGTKEMTRIANRLRAAENEQRPFSMCTVLLLTFLGKTFVLIKMAILNIGMFIATPVIFLPHINAQMVGIH